MPAAAALLHSGWQLAEFSLKGWIYISMQLHHSGAANSTLLLMVAGISKTGQRASHTACVGQPHIQICSSESHALQLLCSCCWRVN